RVMMNHVMNKRDVVIQLMDSENLAHSAKA
ncbi:MAG: hypothetical protein RL183_897, partial [Pseudomonadota bacterium]